MFSLRPHYSVLAAALVASLGLSACGGGSGISLPGALNGKSASTIAKLAMKAGDNASSVHQVITSDVSYTLGRQYGDATHSEGVEYDYQNTMGDPAYGRALVVDGQTFVNDSATMITTQFGIEDYSAANQWLKVPTSDVNYASVHDGVLLPSVVAAVFPLGTLKIVGVQTFDGHKVVALKGSPNPAQTGAKGYQIVYVSTSKPYLPYGSKGRIDYNGQVSTFKTVFSHWNEKVTLTVPAKSSSISKTKIG
jgi:hypothetical protein